MSLGGVTMKFVFDQGQLAANLLSFKDKFERAMSIFCEQGCLKLKTSAQVNRPWTDRTSMARKSLNSDWEKAGDGYRLELSHGVDYGIWLELANEKRYAIIMPTIQRVGHGEIMPAFSGFMEKIGGS